MTVHDDGALAVRDALAHASDDGPVPPSGPSIRRRVRIHRSVTATVAAVGLAGAGLGVAAAVSDAPAPPDRVSVLSPSTTGYLPPLPKDSRPLPGASGRETLVFGVLGRAQPGTSTISRAAALRRYDGMLAATRHGRTVMTALIRAAYVASDARIRLGTFWVVSVWYHPFEQGRSQANTWNVDHGVIDATSGRPALLIPGQVHGTGPQAVV